MDKAKQTNGLGRKVMEIPFFFFVYFQLIFITTSLDPTVFKGYETIGEWTMPSFF